MMRASAIVVCVVMATGVAAAGPLPDSLKPPASFSVDEKYGRELDYDHVELSIDGKHSDVAGKTWIVRLAVTPPNKTADATDKAIRQALEAQGWILPAKTSGVVAHRTKDGKDQWLVGASFSADFRATIVEVGPPPHTLTLAAPGKTIEKVADTEDFPYLGKVPGSTLQHTEISQKAFNISGPGQKEMLAGPPSVLKEYKLAATTSAYERMVMYRDALTKAGWTIIKAAGSGDSQVTAHYAKDGRDIYASLHDGTFQIADIGAQNEAKKLAEALSKDGHVAIYGIYFDVDKDVLKPESETALGHILELLKSDAKLKVEVQGHTDNTGTPVHNKPLSEARAAAVQKWLVDHGISADRMTPKGYGETMPVGDNKTPEGRAKNRRVELKKL